MITRFIHHIQFVRNYSVRTLRSYENNLYRLKAFYDGRDLNTLSSKDIANYVEHLAEAGKKAASINQYLSSFRSYYDYCVKFEGMRQNPALAVRDVRKEKLLPRFIPEDVMNKLIDHHLPTDTWKQRRTRLIILLFYHLGIRCSEMEGLNVNDVDMYRQVVRVLGKGRKERLIPFGQELAEELSAWIYERKDKGFTKTRALIVTEFGEAITSFQIRRITKMALTRVVDKKLAHPHVIRHSFATAMMNNGCRIEHLAKLMGHTSIATTAIYEHCSLGYLKSVFSRCKIR